MYEVHYRRWLDTPKDYSKVGEASTLEEAKNFRAVSGDLVVHRDTHKVVKDSAWLWDWERADPQCYAQRAIRQKV
jgi:hypothetical protein